MALSIEKIKKDTSEVKREVKERTKGYIVGALGLVIGLAWNEAVKALIEYWFPISANSIAAKFFYALFLTVAFAIVAYYFLGLEQNDKKSKKR